jgi:hypothetical protein
MKALEAHVTMHVAEGGHLADPGVARDLGEGPRRRSVLFGCGHEDLQLGTKLLVVLCPAAQCLGDRSDTGLV